MDKNTRAENREGGLLYRLEIRGAVRQARSRWLGAERVTSRGSNTVILLRVADQSDLFGRLRRIHDLNLEFVSVERLDEEGQDHDPDSLG